MAGSPSPWVHGITSVGFGVVVWETADFATLIRARRQTPQEGPRLRLRSVDKPVKWGSA